jgi:copper chaperone CopZ
MKHTYKVTGMTCGGCKASVEKYLSKVKEVTSVTVDLEKREAEVGVNTHVSTETLQKALPEKYTITEKTKEKKIPEIPSTEFMMEEPKSKVQQLKPLFLIIFYITSASILLHYKDWSWGEFMFDFM